MNSNNAVARGFLSIPDRTWQHLSIEVERAARQFSLNEDAKEELFAEIRHKVILAAYNVRLDPEKASLKTYLETVIHNALKDWKDAKGKEQLKDETESRDRRILYSPTRYGTVGQMVRKIDFDLAKLGLTEHELDILNRVVYEYQAVKDIGREMGIGKNKILREWAGIKEKLAKYYGRKLK